MFWTGVASITQVYLLIRVWTRRPGTQAKKTNVQHESGLSLSQIIQNHHEIILPKYL